MPFAAALKVLIVDDQFSVRQMTRMTLQEIGIKHIHESENGKEAFEKAVVQPLDLIISDYNMPEMDGLEATQRICSEFPKGQRPEIVAMTANARPQDVQECLAAGMDGVLTKPVSVDELRGILEKSAGRRKNVTSMSGS